MKIVHGRPPVITGEDLETSTMVTMAEASESEEKFEEAVFYWNQYAKVMANSGNRREMGKALMRVAENQRKFMQFSLVIEHESNVLTIEDT